MFPLVKCAVMVQLTKKVVEEAGVKAILLPGDLASEIVCKCAAALNLSQPYGLPVSWCYTSCAAWDSNLQASEVLLVLMEGC